jgi:hypothetical protein
MELGERKRVRIEFRDLPPRARLVTAGELSRIFGGCGRDQAQCKSDKDCCDGFHCLTSSWNVCVSAT